MSVVRVGRQAGRQAGMYVVCVGPIQSVHRSVGIDQYIHPSINFPPTCLLGAAVVPEGGDGDMNGGVVQLPRVRHGGVPLRCWRCGGGWFGIAVKRAYVEAIRFDSTLSNGSH